MAFKAVGGAPKVRLEKLSKAELIRTIKTLQKRETKLLNQIAKLQEAALVAACEAEPAWVAPWDTK